MWTVELFSDLELNFSDHGFIENNIYQARLAMW